MSVANIFVKVPSTGNPAVDVDKINPELYDTTAPPFTGFVTNPLSANLQCKQGVTNYEIREAGVVNTAVLETLQIDLLPGSLQSAVAVNDSLAMKVNKRIGFDADAIVTCGGGLKSIVRTRDTLLPTIQYEFADEKVVYSEQLRHLTVNPPTIPPQPLLPSQGLTVHGTIAAQNGGISATGDVQTTGIFIAKEGTNQPRVEFQNSAGVAQGQVGWSAVSGKTLLNGDALKVYSGLDKYKIEMGDHIGYLGIETSGVDTEIRHYDATATTMETRVRVGAGGNVAIGGAYDGSLFLETAVGSAYGGMNIDSGGTIHLFAGGGDVAADQPFIPYGGIKDTTASTGAPGQFLAKDGTNQLKWEYAVPGTWSGVATSDLDMNGFKITDNTGNLNIQSVGIFNVALKNSAGDVVLEVGEDPLSVKQISLATVGGSKLVQTFNDTQIVGDTASAYTPTLRFIDANNPSYSIPITADPPNLFLQTGARKFQLFAGANAICSLFANDMTGESGVEVEGGVDLQLRTNGAEVVGTIDSLGTPKSFRFGSANNTLYLTDNTNQDVNVDNFAQFTTTQCAVPRQIRDAVNGTITAVPLQTTPLYAGSTFSWLYSGSRNASSAFCASQRVEVEVDVVLTGSLSDDFQFAVSLYNQTTVQDILPDNYDGVNGTTAFTGLQPAVSHVNTAFADQTVFIKFASVFACGGNFTDGDQVEPRLWAMCRSGTHTVNSGRINLRVRPLTVW